MPQSVSLLRWADFGCSLRGGVVIAERSVQFGEADQTIIVLYVHVGCWRLEM